MKNANLKQIFEKALENSKVSDGEYSSIISKVDSVIEKLEFSLIKNKVTAEIMLGGSAAKRTLLKGDFDCDVFVMFDKKYNDDKISDLLEKALSIFKGIERVHGSRDYFQLIYEGIKYEFVPVIRIEVAKEARNVTDVSPMHVSWIRKKIEKNPDLREEILLTKLFCKAQNIYGAESYISGFSGHVIDILVSYYGSFENLLRDAKMWQMHKVIDIEGHNTADEINESKISPLIVIDPIQKERNAAAALSLGKFNIFKKKALEFMKKPDISYFIIKEETDKELENLSGKNRFILIKAQAKEGKRDVVGGKLLKIFNYLEKNITRHDFEVLGSGWNWDKKKNARMWYIIKKEKLSEIKIIEGPPIGAKMHVERFKNAHTDTFEKKGRIYANIKREYIEPFALVKHILADAFVKERVDNISLKRITKEE